MSGGGGSGGSIILLVTGQFLPDPTGATLSAVGGSSTSGELVPGGTAGGGGGGRIHIISPNNQVPDNIDTLVDGGRGECGQAEGGSVYKVEGRRTCTVENSAATFTCVCDDGWTGTLCDT